jgi:hypothetical protein
MRSHIIRQFKMCLVGTSIFLATLLLAGCATKAAPQKTSLEIQAIQTKEFETNYKSGFRSVVSVLQDLGYIIKEADMDTGLVSAQSSKTAGFKPFVGTASSWRDATAFVEEMPSGLISVRLNFVDEEETSSGYGQKGAKSVPILDPVVYQDTFEKIEKAIFVRSATS